MIMISEEEKKINRDILFIYNNVKVGEESVIDSDLVERVYDMLERAKIYSQLRIVLNTMGGNIAAGARLVNIINDVYDSYDTVVMNRCGSTGTLIALGGSKIWCTPKTLITPSEPQMLLTSNKRVSVSLIRNIIENYKVIKKFNLSLNSIDLGNYYSTINNYKDLCKQIYGDLKGKEISSFMLEQVNSHNYPLSKEDLIKCRVEVDSIDEESKQFYKYYYDDIVKKQGLFFDSNDFEERNTILKSRNETMVYKKVYDKETKKLKKEGYFID